MCFEHPGRVCHILFSLRPRLKLSRTTIADTKVTRSKTIDTQADGDATERCQPSLLFGEEFSVKYVPKIRSDFHT